MNKNITPECELIYLDDERKIILKLRSLLLKNKHSVSEIEFTTGNYNASGDEIKQALPTITTDYCEMGIYDNIIYFTFIIFSKEFNKTLFDSVKNFKNMQMYGFIDFKTILYPKNNFNYDEFAKIILEDKYLQINFNYDKSAAKSLYESYKKVVGIFEKNKINIINQRLNRCS